MDELQLAVTSFTDVTHWRWRLTDTHGAFKADHQVALNQADPAYDAFIDLYRYLCYHTTPDRRLENEADQIYRRAVARLFSGEYDALTALKLKDVAEELEAAADALEDVADAVETIAVKES